MTSRYNQKQTTFGAQNPFFWCEVETTDWVIKQKLKMTAVIWSLITCVLLRSFPKGGLIVSVKKVGLKVSVLV